VTGDSTTRANQFRLANGTRSRSGEPSIVGSYRDVYGPDHFRLLILASLKRRLIAHLGPECIAARPCPPNGSARDSRCRSSSASRSARMSPEDRTEHSSTFRSASARSRDGLCGDVARLPTADATTPPIGPWSTYWRCAPGTTLAARAMQSLDIESRGRLDLRLEGAVVDRTHQPDGQPVDEDGTAARELSARPARLCAKPSGGPDWGARFQMTLLFAT
jgi:hypothetical protein